MDSCIANFIELSKINCDAIPMQSIKITVNPLAGKETNVKMAGNLNGRGKKNTHLYKIIVYDTGTGVKANKVKSLFGEYFSSTKIKTDKNIGCFGM